MEINRKKKRKTSSPLFMQNPSSSASSSITTTAVYHPPSFQQFDEWIRKKQQEQRLVIVRYSTTWCGPCRQTLPLLEKLAGEFQNVCFATIDVDKWEGTEIESVEQTFNAFPTFHFVYQNNVQATLEGFDEAKIRNFILSGRLI